MEHRDDDEVVVVRPGHSFRFNLRELAAHRELLYFFVWRDIKVLYKQTAIGAAWAIVQPLFIMLVFIVIFDRLAGLDTGGLDPPIFYYSGLVLWTYFANAVTRSTHSLVQHQLLITKVYFPRILLPLSAVAAGWLDLAVSAIVLVGLMVYFQVMPSPAILTLPLWVALASLAACGAGIWLSALNAVYRDVRHAMPLVMQLWLFASPIAYSSSLVPPAWRPLYYLNPMAAAVDGFRWSLTSRGTVALEHVFVSAIVGIVLLASGLAVFHRLESHLVDVI